CCGLFRDRKDRHAERCGDERSTGGRGRVEAPAGHATSPGRDGPAACCSAKKKPVPCRHQVVRNRNASLREDGTIPPMVVIGTVVVAVQWIAHKEH
ncbi:hypothetical protein, partial [Methanoregula sp.]|uniref:hypothetical protein n=1 Tax=Methanoregula sp. TaxID=2052170 RepID=UPI0025D2725D